MSNLRETSLGTFLDEVSSARPTPGGGSVSAVVASLAAALGCMVAHIGQAKGANPRLHALAASCSQQREEMLQLSERDRDAFEQVMAVLRLPGDAPARSERREAALRAAAEVPLELAQKCLALLEVLESLLPLSSRHCVSDVGAAAQFASAAAGTCVLNVLINGSFMTDASLRQRVESEARRVQRESRASEKRIVDQVLGRIRG